MEFRILGSLDVVADGAPVAVGAGKPRVLLLALLLARGEAVSVDRLADALWGEQPPATAAKSIHVYVSQLRKALGDVIETRGRGYLLRVDPEQLDAARFERLLDRGRECLAAGEAPEAAAVLRQALGLWRGPALADVAYEPFAQAEIARLEELRLSALEERIDADLALGRHGPLVGELEALVREHPLRERLHGQLMLALYGSGRQADALDAYQRARKALVDGLGIEPGPGLRQVHEAVLRQDPDLRTRAGVTARVRARRRSGVLIAVGGGLVVLAALVAGALALSRDDGPALGRVRPLPASFCSPLQYSAGAHPQLLVVSDQPLGGPLADLGNEIAGAVEFVVRRREFRAGAYAIGYQACNASAPDDEFGDERVCRRNASAYVGERSVIGIIGPTISACAREQIPVTSDARGGPLAMVSPSNTRVGLTRTGPGVEEGEPGAYYRRGSRNYVRLMPADDLQAAAGAMLAERLGRRRVFVLGLRDDRSVTEPFAQAAGKLGLDVVGILDPQEASPAAVARRVAAARPDAVYIGAPGSDIARELFMALRQAGPAGLTLIAPDGFSDPAAIRDLGRAGEGLWVTVSGVAPTSLSGRGRALVAELREASGRAPHQYAVYAAQATELLLDAVARSDGTRPSVVRELFASDVRGGILGDFSVTETGDTTATQVTVYRVRKGELAFERILRPPVNLITGS